MESNKQPSDEAGIFYKMPFSLKKFQCPKNEDVKNNLRSLLFFWSMVFLQMASMALSAAGLEESEKANVPQLTPQQGHHRAPPLPIYPGVPGTTSVPGSTYQSTGLIQAK